jgi:uncharacterized protein YkwD
MFRFAELDIYMIKLILVFIFSTQIIANAQDANDIYFLKLVNEHRGENGLAPVRYDALIDSACKAQSDYQLRVRKTTHYQEKESPADTEVLYYPVNRVAKFDPGFAKKYDQTQVMENCAMWGFKGSRFEPEMRFDTLLVRKIFNMWVASPGHNAALLFKTATVVALEFSARKTETYNKVLGFINYDVKIYATALFVKEFKLLK